MEKEERGLCVGVWAFITSHILFVTDKLVTQQYLTGSVVKNLPANVGDTGHAGLIPGLGRSLGVGNGNSLQYSCLENSRDRGAWRITIHGVTKSWT